MFLQWKRLGSWFSHWCIFVYNALGGFVFIIENPIHYLVIKIYGVSNVLRYCNSHCPKNRNGIVKKVQHRNWYGNKRHLCQTSFTSNHLRLLCLFVLAFLCLSWIHLMWIIENMDKKEHIMSKKLCNIF